MLDFDNISKVYNFSAYYGDQIKKLAPLDVLYHKNEALFQFVLSFL